MGGVSAMKLISLSEKVKSGCVSARSCFLSYSQWIIGGYCHFFRPPSPREIEKDVGISQKFLRPAAAGQTGGQRPAALLVLGQIHAYSGSGVREF
jgi:TPR repeat protein